MIWPFKKTQKVTLAEFVAQFPPAPCGDQEAHYEWTLQGVVCPCCAAIRTRRQKDAELDALADKIVARLRVSAPHGTGGDGNG
jgi:hypothetical protein